jgi:YVTN family beta-propeller protein
LLSRKTAIVLLSFGGVLYFSLWSLSGSVSKAGVPRSRRSMYARPEDDLYKSPVQMVLSKNGRRLFAACENTDEVLFLDTELRKVTGSVKVGRHPFGLALSPDETRLYVSNRVDNSVSEIDVANGVVRRTVAVPGDPHQLRTDASGKYLYVANMIANHVSLIDTAAFEQVKTMEAGTYPFGMVLGPEGRYLYISNQLSSPVPFRTPPVLELTVIDTQKQLVTGRRNLFSTVIGQQVVVSPDGEFVVVALELPKNLLPETQVYQGWMVTHGFAVVEAGAKGKAAYFLLDEPNLYFADPYAAVFSPDGRYLYISSSGVDIVSVVDFSKVRQLLKASGGKIGIADETIRTYARNLALSSEYVAARIPTGSNPKDIVLSPDGRWLYIANRLSDTIQVVDAQTRKTAAQIELGGPKLETELRRGEKLFNYSTISFQKQLSCNTCHPEYHVDGLLYDIVAPGDPIGRDLVDNKTQRGIAETAPFKWNGKNPTLARQDGPRAAMLFFRSHGFDKKQLEEIVRFVESVPVPLSRYLGSDGTLNDFQEEGKKYFERDFTKDGRYIPVNNRCFTCHRPPIYTDQKLEDVGTRADHDTESSFDTPQVSNVAETAPYLHDGRCYSLEEIWTVYNPEDLHGVTNDMDKRQLNVLIEYIKTLTIGAPMSDEEMMRTMFPPSTRARSALRLEEKASVPDPPFKYVGNMVCAGCHMNQYKAWLGTKHARTWVMLQRELAKTIGKEMGIKASSPQYSGICLECHGTAANYPEPFRADGFHVEEGVQCERCHGPGGYHASADIMRDKDKAKSLGLRKATKEDCLVCHKAKPSHKVLGRPPFDFDKYWSRVKH